MEDRLYQQGVLTVKTCLLTTTFVASLTVVLGLLVSDAPTQAQPARPAPTQPGTKVATIDMGYIFKNDPSFKQQMERLRNEVQAVDQQLRKEYEAIQNLEKLRQGLNPDSAKFGELESEIARRKVELQTKTRNQRRKFVEKETQIRYDEYRKIRDEVKYFAELYGISLVLRVSRDQADPNKSARARLALVNRRVLYGNKRIDITEQILKALQARFAHVPKRRPGVGEFTPPRR